MTQESYQYGDIQWDRSEIFALGAAAGAVITAAITEYLDRRKPKTAWEKAQARGAEAVEAVTAGAKRGRKQAKGYADVASEYVQDVLEAAPKQWKQTKKSAAKQTKQMRKQAIGLKEAAAGVVGAAAANSVVDKVRDYATSAAERVGDPYAVSGSIKETLKEQYESLLGSSSNGKLSDTAREVGGSAVETIKQVASSAADVMKDYTASARETIKDAELGDRARTIGATTASALKEYTTTARETIKDAHLGDKAKDYSSLVADTVKEYASTARETLKDAELGDKLKDYATVAGAAVATYSTQAAKATRKTAQQSATKLTESATHLAHATTDQAGELRKGVRKGVKRTRRRARWGLRAFVIGLVVGLLSAPQSGQRTRDAVTSFVENILDVFMPEEQGRSTGSV